MEFSGLPFVAGSIRGERCWLLRNGELHSPQQPFWWKPGENLSMCLRSANGRFHVNINDLLLKHFLPGKEITCIEYDQGGKHFTVYAPDLVTASYTGGLPFVASPSNPEYYLTVHWRELHLNVNWCDSENDKPLLETSIQRGTERIPWRDFHSVAQKIYRHDHANCTCGFYAYLNGINGYQSNCHVIGVIEGYGETTIGTRGFRAQKAKILALAPTVPFQSSRDKNDVIFSMDFANISRNGLSRFNLVRRKENRAEVYYANTENHTYATNKNDWKLLKANYPDAVLFRNVDLMRKEFPATKVDEVL